MSTYILTEAGGRLLLESGAGVLTEIQPVVAVFVPPPGMAVCDLGVYLPPDETIRRISAIRYSTRIGFDAVAGQRFHTVPMLIPPATVLYPVGPGITEVEIDVRLSDGTRMTCVDVLANGVA